MTMLAQYAVMQQQLAAASHVDEVLTLHSNVKFLKLHARQIRDRALMAEAMVFQLHCERQLGLMLASAKEAGQISEGRPKKVVDAPEGVARVMLTEVGVDRKLSSKAQRAAKLSVPDFNAILDQVRENLAAGGSVMVDPIGAAAKAAEVTARRQAHAQRALTGGCIADLGALVRQGKRFGTVGADPQWKFLTRSAEGDGRSANVHYKTEEVDKIKDMPVNELLADDGAFYMWMVDWCPQDALDLLKHWGLRHVTTAFTWVKTNPSGEGFHMGQGYWSRANPEQCWLATKGEPKRLYADVQQLIIAPVMEHSRKPDEWLERAERLTGGDYLELNARRPRKGWTSWGDELEFTGMAA